MRDRVVLEFPIRFVVRDQRGLSFRILTSLCIVASIFHRLNFGRRDRIADDSLEVHITLNFQRLDVRMHLLEH